MYWAMLANIIIDFWSGLSCNNVSFKLKDDPLSCSSGNNASHHGSMESGLFFTLSFYIYPNFDISQTCVGQDSKFGS